MTEMKPSHLSIDKQDVSALLEEVLEGGDLLFIVPPFFGLDAIPLGPYLLKAIARQQGVQADVLQLDLLLAKYIGIDDYLHIQRSTFFWLLGERMFARSAYGLPSLGKNAHRIDDPVFALGREHNGTVYLTDPDAFSLHKYQELEAFCYQFVEVVSQVISEYAYKMIGCSIGFCNQINASIALINNIKPLVPEAKILVGGSFCDGEKAPSLLELCPNIDHLFIGECDYTFVQFLDAFVKGGDLGPQCIKGDKEVNMNDLPLPTYEAYHQQVINFLGDEFWHNEVKTIWYESNRGCWWAEMAKCIFCGIQDVSFRKRDTKMILEDLAIIQEHFPEKYLIFTDLIMTESFTKEVLNHAGPNPSLPKLGFQLKVGKTLGEVHRLYLCNTRLVVAGIESLSTKLLKKMRKGTMGKDNLYFLRNARSMNIRVLYSFLWGFPDDGPEDYEHLLELIPKIPHLTPVRDYEGVRIMRDSPLFEEADSFGIEKMDPLRAYEDIYPPGMARAEIANYFTGEFECYSFTNPDVIQQIGELVLTWRKIHKQSTLAISALSPNDFLLEDFRRFPGHEMSVHMLGRAQAEEVMTPARWTATETQVWAESHGFGVIMDDWYIPLVTAPPHLLLELDKGDEYWNKRKVRSKALS